MSKERKKLFSEKVSAGSRTYFFDVKESADGVKYLVISESRQGKGKVYKHNCIMIFQEHLKTFNNGFQKVVNFMMKESKSKVCNNKQIGCEYPKTYRNGPRRGHLPNK
jgi:hypothetical protein